MDELFPAWRHHAVFTDSPFELVQAEGQHRGHAVVEQAFADVTSGPLAHLPSGHFAANAAWLSICPVSSELRQSRQREASRLSPEMNETDSLLTCNYGNSAVRRASRTCLVISGTVAVWLSHALEASQLSPLPVPHL